MPPLALVVSLALALAAALVVALALALASALALLMAKEAERPQQSAWQGRRQQLPAPLQLAVLDWAEDSVAQATGANCRVAWSPQE